LEGLALLSLIYFKEKEYELKRAPPFLVLRTGYKMSASVPHGTPLPAAYSVLYSRAL